MSEHYVRRNEDGTETWLDHAIPRSHIRAIRQRISEVEPELRRLGLPEYHAVLNRLAQLERHAPSDGDDGDGDGDGGSLPPGDGPRGPVAGAPDAVEGAEALDAVARSQPGDARAAAALRAAGLKQPADMLHAPVVGEFYGGRASVLGTQNASRWKLLDPPTRDLLGDRYPRVVGEADGVPPEFRDKLNRAHMNDLVAAVVAEADLRGAGLGRRRRWRGREKVPVHLLSFGSSAPISAGAPVGRSQVTVSFGHAQSAPLVIWYIPDTAVSRGAMISNIAEAVGLYARYRDADKKVAVVAVLRHDAHPAAASRSFDALLAESIALTQRVFGAVRTENGERSLYARGDGNHVAREMVRYIAPLKMYGLDIGWARPVLVPADPSTEDRSDDIEMGRSTLRTSDWRSVEPRSRSAMLASVPEELGNSDRVTAEGRDAANRRLLADERRDRREAGAALAGELALLDDQISMLAEAERLTDGLPGWRPVLQVVSLDLPKYGGQGKPFLSFGNIDLAKTVTVHVRTGPITADAMGAGVRFLAEHYRVAFTGEAHASVLVHAAGADQLVRDLEWLYRLRTMRSVSPGMPDKLAYLPTVTLVGYDSDSTNLAAQAYNDPEMDQYRDWLTMPVDEVPAPRSHTPENRGGAPTGDGVVGYLQPNAVGGQEHKEFGPGRGREDRVGGVDDVLAELGGPRGPRAPRDRRRDPAVFHALDDELDQNARAVPTGELRGAGAPGAVAQPGGNPRLVQLTRAQHAADVAYERLQQRRRDVVTELDWDPAAPTAELLAGEHENTELLAELREIEEKEKRFEHLRVLGRRHLFAVLDDARHRPVREAVDSAQPVADLDRQLENHLALLEIDPDDAVRGPYGDAVAAVQTLAALLGDEVIRRPSAADFGAVAGDLSEATGGRLLRYPGQEYLVQDLLSREPGAVALVVESSGSSVSRYVLLNYDEQHATQRPPRMYRQYGPIMMIDLDSGVVREFTPDTDTGRTVEAVFFDADKTPVHPLDGEWQTIPQYQATGADRRRDDAVRIYAAVREQMRRGGRLDDVLVNLQGWAAGRLRALVNHFGATVDFRELAVELGLDPETLSLQQLTQMQAMSSGGLRRDELLPMDRLFGLAEQVLECEYALQRPEERVAELLAQLPPAAITPEDRADFRGSAVAMAAAALNRNRNIRPLRGDMALAGGTAGYALAAAFGIRPWRFPDSTRRYPRY